MAAKEAPIPDDAISDESALLSKSFTSYGGSHPSLALSTSFLDVKTCTKRLEVGKQLCQVPAMGCLWPIVGVERRLD